MWRSAIFHPRASVYKSAVKRNTFLKNSVSRLLKKTHRPGAQTKWGIGVTEYWIIGA
jgi:hypothetical protein